MLVYMTTVPEEFALFPINVDIHLRRYWDEKVNVGLARIDLYGPFQTRPKIPSLTRFTQHMLLPSGSFLVLACAENKISVTADLDHFASLLLCSFVKHVTMAGVYCRNN